MNVSSLLTIDDWRAAYRGGAKPAALLQALHHRLEAHSPREAWIQRSTAAQLQARAAALGLRAASHPDRASAMAAMPLFGVPFAVKDNIDVAGFATTAACPAFEREAQADAAAVARLLDAGAVCVGKTNLDQFATGLVGARSPYGRPVSALAAGRVSGGSSSGSAVAVARGDVPFALGTDTAGSGRVPAGFNNIVGLKPTPGRVSTRGVVPACRTLDCISVFALTVADAAEVLALVEGSDGRDAYSAFTTGRARFTPRLRVGVPAAPLWGGEDIGYLAAFDAAKARLQSLGHSVVAIDFGPLHDVGRLLYSGPWVAERHAVVQALLERNPAALDASVRTVIDAARGFSATDAFRAQYVLRGAQRDLEALWQQADLLMVPTAPAHPTHGDIDADPLGANALLGTYTNFVNLLGWCALAVPASITPQGLPFGVTFIAPAAADAALARFGQAWQAQAALPLGATGRRCGENGDAAGGLHHGIAANLDAPPDRGPARDTAASSGPGDATAARAWPASEATLPIAVVGAHLSGLPLNGQLTERRAVLREATATAPRYRLFALPNTTPPKPGLQRVAAPDGGAAIAVEVWDVPLAEVGSFLASIPPPLALGSLELADGRWVHGFVCEGHALAAARDITAFGGWRPFLQSQAAQAA